MKLSACDWLLLIAALAFAGVCILVYGSIQAYKAHRAGAFRDPFDIGPDEGDDE